MKKINIGILASVDSGKTTLSESMLFVSGAIKNQGKIDNKDTVLDNNAIERNRGITIFSKVARFSYGDANITLVDTPGHVDFSYETESVLNVLDICILLISATDMVTGHTKTLWDMLKRYDVPTFIFINKLDQAGANKLNCIEDITNKLSANALDFENFNDDFFENLAMNDEDMLDKFLEEGSLDDEDITMLISKRKVFPIYGGVATKSEGVKELLDAITKYALKKKYGDEFGAFVYKINRDKNDNRLTHLKITGGSLAVKDVILEDKVNEIRLYNGDSYETVDRAYAGDIVALTGLRETKIGSGVGVDKTIIEPITNAVLNYSINALNNDNYNEVYNIFKTLEEENPTLKTKYQNETKELTVSLLGEVQMEVLKSMVEDRFGLLIEYGEGKVLYKETVNSLSYGVGHYEPLRHYAEVGLTIEPLERGEGLVFESKISKDQLATNWQRLILTHLEEKEHVGVLTGSPITDVKISIVAGRAHPKHTEGGDFRQATYRAIRHGLMNNDCKLLEPYYSFTIMLPREHIGRCMMDVEKMSGTCSVTEDNSDSVMITGRGPVSSFKNYQKELTSYTHGQASIVCIFDGYDDCHNEDEVIAECGYDPLLDENNPVGSIFCSHGAGYYVPWDEVYDKKHTTDDNFNKYKNIYLGGSEEDFGELSDEDIIDIAKENAKVRQQELKKEEKSLEKIFADAYGIKGNTDNIFHTNQSNEQIRGKLNASKRKVTVNGKVRNDKPYVYKPVKRQKKLLVVDGYNVIYAVSSLKQLSKDNIDGARDELNDLLCVYKSYFDGDVYVVYDAYNVKGSSDRNEEYKGINVFYTKENQTADTFIEMMAGKFGRNLDMTVVSSDNLIGITALSFGCKVISSREFERELEDIKKRISKKVEEIGKQEDGKSYLLDQVNDDVKAFIESLKDKE